jgi:hypothetical protein
MKLATRLLLIATLGLAGCAPKAPDESVATPMVSAPPATPMALPDAMPAASAPAERKAMRGAVAADADAPAGGEAAKDAGKPANSSAAQTNRKVIYTGQINLEVADISQSVGKVQAVAKRFGGYVTGLQQSGGGAEQATLTLRVKAESFDEALGELAKLGKVLHREIATQDVGEEWVDLEARTKTKKHEEQRLLELLQRAGQVAQLLEVERELARVRGEIEQAEGRLRYLGNQVALSTVTVSLQKPAARTPSGWRLGGAWSDASKLFLVTGQRVITLVLNLLALAPYLALAWLVVKLLRRIRRRA